MTDAKTVAHPSQPILMNAEPTLFVTDFPRSLAFFTQMMGFKVAFTYGEPAFFGQVVRDGAALNLRFVHRPVLIAGDEPDLLSASIWVSHAKQLFLEFQAKDAVFHQPLRREPADHDLVVDARRRRLVALERDGRQTVSESERVDPLGGGRQQ